MWFRATRSICERQRDFLWVSFMSQAILKRSVVWSVCECGLNVWVIKKITLPHIHNFDKKPYNIEQLTNYVREPMLNMILLLALSDRKVSVLALLSKLQYDTIISTYIIYSSSISAAHLLT